MLHVSETSASLQLSRSYVDGLRSLRRHLFLSRLESLELDTSRDFTSTNNCAVHNLSIDQHDYRYLLSARSNLVSLYDLERLPDNTIRSSADRYVSANIGDAVTSMEWFPADTGAFITSSSIGEVQIWDTASFCPVETITMNYGVMSISISPFIGHSDTSLIAVGGHSKYVYILDPLTGDHSHTLAGHADTVSVVAWSPIQPFELITASIDGTMKLWDIRKGSTHGMILSFDWMQDTERVTVKHDADSLRTYKFIDWARDSRGRAHEGAIRCMRYSKCGNYVVSAGNDTKIRLWSARDGQLLPRNFPSSCRSDLNYSADIASLESTKDQRLVISGHQGDILIIPLFNPNEPVTTLKGHMKMVNAIAYRKITQEIISGGRDKLTFVWKSLPKSCERQIDNDDDWSDGDEQQPLQGRQPQNEESAVTNLTYFVPPIIQQYLNGVDSTSVSNEHGLNRAEPTLASESAEATERPPKKPRKQASLPGIQQLRQIYLPKKAHVRR